MCQGRKYPVHKALLCSRSRYFDGACNGHFVVSTWTDGKQPGLRSSFQESKTGELDLSEEDEEAVEHMVHYFYHLDYLEENDADDEAKVAPAHSRRVQAAPVKLDLSKIEDPLLATAHASSATQSHGSTNLSGLEDDTASIEQPTSSAGSFTQTMCKSRRRQSALKPRIERSTFREDGNCAIPAWQSYSHDDQAIDATDDEMESEFLVHARVYALAEKFGILGLKSLAKAKFEILSSESWDDPGFLDALEEVYTTTIDQDRGLRDVILQVFRRNPDLEYRLDVQDALRDVPTLAYDLNRAIPGITIRT